MNTTLSETQTKNSAELTLVHMLLFFGVRLEQLQAPDRHRELCDIRKLIYLTLRNRCNMPYKRIGKLMNRHHASVIFALKEANALVIYNKDFASRTNELNEYLNNQIGMHGHEN
ncbi:helix-turn-helix domain-containing protein [Solitalea koreensis]|uniref:DnaA protein helix-turn-helix n=1 Tax=Solitalea koreensis TaxID=543615 RepID=A0A521BMM4_9SPHI|nr:helix-turn-helix domain-containing protein [Solitalea koreensis]SMO48352.1 dnaA protein helix-turn-helix [Solitalea koreensis]